MLSVADGIGDRIWLSIPQTTEWQRIADEIDAAFVFAGGTDFVNVLRIGHATASPPGAESIFRHALAVTGSACPLPATLVFPCGKRAPLLPDLAISGVGFVLVTCRNHEYTLRP